MSVQSENSSIQYNGNNSTVTAYAVPYPFFTDNDLVVVITQPDTGAETTLVLNTDYTVSGAGADEGGSILTVEPIPETHKVTIYREIVATQPLQYEEADDFPAASHEQGLDRLTFLSQQNSRKLTAGFRLRESDGGVTSFAKVANALVGIDADGTAKMFTGAMIQALLNLPQTVLDQPTKTFSNAAARAAATPDFLGQVGVQLDSVTLYVGTSIAAGGWTVYDFTLGADSVGTTQIQNSAITPEKLAGTLDLSGKTDVVLPPSSIHGRTLGTSLADGDEMLWWKASDGTLQRITKVCLTDLFQPSGSVLQRFDLQYTSTTTITNTIPLTTSPQSSQGLAIWTHTFKPTSASSKIRLEGVLMASGSGANCYPVLAVFFNGGTNAIWATIGGYGTSGYSQQFPFCFNHFPGTTSDVTYSVHVGPAAGEIYPNRHYNGETLGGLIKSTLTIQEIKA